MNQMPSYTGLGRAWAAFTRPVDALPVDIFRVCAGFVLLAYFIRTFLDVKNFSSADGLLDHDLILEMFWFTEIGIFRPWMGIEWFYAAFLMACACCVPIIIGWRVKLFAFILYVIAVSTYRHNFIVMYVDDSIMHLLLFWMLVLPVGKTLVLGELLSNSRAAWESWKTVRVPGSALRLFFWNLTLLYLVAGLWKWTSPMWLDGTALYVVFKLPISYFHAFWQPEHIPLLRVFSYATLVVEPLVPLLFILRPGSRLKYALLAAFLGLHVLSALTLDIPYANVACAATAILMFRKEIMQFLGGRKDVCIDPWPSRLGLSGAVALFMVATLTLAMLSSVSLPNWRTAPRELQTQGVYNDLPVSARPKFADDRNEGLRSVQMTFFGTLWIMGIAQQYQLFNWIDDRNYSAEYRVIDGGRDVPPDAMFLRSLRGVLLDFYIHDVTWTRIPPEHRDALRSSILTRTADRYCRRQTPSGSVQVFSSVRRIDPRKPPETVEITPMIEFECDTGTAKFSLGP